MCCTIVALYQNCFFSHSLHWVFEIQAFLKNPFDPKRRFFLHYLNARNVTAWLPRCVACRAAQTVATSYHRQVFLHTKLLQQWHLTKSVGTLATAAKVSCKYIQNDVKRHQKTKLVNSNTLKIQVTART